MRSRGAFKLLEEALHSGAADSCPAGLQLVYGIEQIELSSLTGVSKKVLINGFLLCFKAGTLAERPCFSQKWGKQTKCNPG